MATDYESNKFTSDFKTERQRILNALKGVEEQEKRVNDLIVELSASLKRDRNAMSASIRLNEQLTSIRNLKASLIRDLTRLRQDMLARALRLAQANEANGGSGADSAPTADTVRQLQTILLSPGSTLILLEPGDADAIIASRMAQAGGQDEPDAAAAEPGAIPTDIATGDIVSDLNGNLFVVGEEGAEELGSTAAEVVQEADGVPAHAVLDDGRVVLVVEID